MTTRQTLELLRRYESRNVTFADPDGSWPIVWQRANGAHVWDAEDRRYLDLTAAFGVAAAGHANRQVVRAGQLQMETLLHAMGDVHPHALKAKLARKLSQITFQRWGRRSQFTQPVHSPPCCDGGQATRPTGKTIFCNSGFEAVEAALKTALLATGRPGVIAFEGAYHGLGYGTLNTTYRRHFHGPFENQLRKFGHFLPFPVAPDVNRRQSTEHIAGDNLRGLASMGAELFRHHQIGAILVEPVQARGGINISPPGFLPLLRKLCDQHGALLIADEIYTGFGRTGRWFACEHSGTVPDLICLGKALTGGFPMSACVGRADVMDTAWPESNGEAIHTSTFLGHPVGCAMALAQIAEIQRLKLVQWSARGGNMLLRGLKEIHTTRNTQAVRGLGLMAGLELRRLDGSPATGEVIRIIQRMLHRGFILLPEGEHGNVIGFTPPLTITEPQLKRTIRALQKELAAALCG